MASKEFADEMANRPNFWMFDKGILYPYIFTIRFPS
jgi:hypothetical protein